MGGTGAGEHRRLGMSGPRHPSVGLWAGKKGWLAMEQNSKSGLGRHKVGLPRWPMPPRGDQKSKFGHPIHGLRTGTVKGKDK